MLDSGKRKGSAMNIEIAQRLYELRRKHGYSQEQLAAELGLSRQAISKWERSESAPDMGNLIALADLYGMTIDELIRPDADQMDEAADTGLDAFVASSAIEDSPDTSSIENSPSDEGSHNVVSEEDIFVDETHDVASATSVFKENVCEKPDNIDLGQSPEQDSSVDPEPSFIAEDHAQASSVQPPADDLAKQVQAHGHIYTKPVNAGIRPRCALRRFPYPLLVVVLFLIMALVFGMWEYMWLFLTIPFYYWIARVIERDPKFLASHGYASDEYASEQSSVQQEPLVQSEPSVSYPVEADPNTAYSKAYSIDVEEVQ